MRRWICSARCPLPAAPQMHMPSFEQGLALNIRFLTSGSKEMAGCSLGRIMSVSRSNASRSLPRKAQERLLLRARSLRPSCSSTRGFSMDINQNGQSMGVYGLCLCLGPMSVVYRYKSTIESMPRPISMVRCVCYADYLELFIERTSRLKSR